MRRPWALLLLLLAVRPLPAQDNASVRFEPLLMDAATIQPFRHRVETRVDLTLDNYKAPVGTETLKGLYTRSQVLLEYRYAPAGNAEIFFRGIYTAQDVAFTSLDGRRVDGRYAAGMSPPTIGFKLRLSAGTALVLHTTPPTAASRDPRLGDGTHDGGELLFRGGVWHLALGHAVRLPYDVKGSSRTFQRNPGDVTEVSIALTKRDNPSETKSDTVGPVAELHGVYADRDRLDGQGVKGSSALTGKAVFGFVLGKINPRATHLTRLAVAAGFGKTLHKTEDPFFGIGDLQFMVGYTLLWGKLP